MPTPFSDDTTPAAHEVYVALLRRKTVSERAQMVARLNEAVDAMATSRLVRDHPNDTPRQRRLRLQALKYGAELMARAFGWDGERERR